MSGIVNGKIRAAWEKKLRTDIARHQQIEPTADPRKIVERIIRQEKERQELKLQRLLAAENEGEDDATELLFLRAMIKDVLPELEAALKQRC